MSDTTLYRSILAAYEQAAATSGGDLPPLVEVHSLDQEWIDEVTQRNQTQRNKLETELKTYTSKMIKESIRVGVVMLSVNLAYIKWPHSQMAYRDLGEFYRTIGDHAAALKHYTKSREFCTTSQHVLEMCLSVLEVRYHLPILYTARMCRSRKWRRKHIEPSGTRLSCHFGLH